MSLDDGHIHGFFTNCTFCTKPGAGAAGSSTAYHLRTYAQKYGLALNITLFEKTDRIGGRTLTVNPWDDTTTRVELGASIFIEKNQILYRALGEFDLKTRDPDDGSDPTLGIWDGNRFVFTVNTDNSFWWNAYKVVMKYGVFAPRRTQKLMETTIAKFLQLYEEPHFPFRSLTQRAYELGLVEITGVTGEQLLKSGSVGDLYAHDIVQASTRVNYASNLAQIHGLDTMVSMAPEGAMAVLGGNWQIFDNMVQRSGANVALNTSVVSIHFAEKNEETTSLPTKYNIQTASTSKPDAEETHPIQFDDVVIATPYQFSKISAAEGVIQHPIDEIPYVQLHVTLFASPFQFSPAFFDLKDGDAVPAGVLTTLAKDDEPTSGVQGAGKAGFFSATQIRKLVNPNTKREEYIYKIFSPEKVTSDFLSRLLGVTVPETFVETTEPSKSELSPISWYYPHVFYSYPKALPRVTFEDPVIGPGLWYTSGMDSFISTMETNALMGKNVARLIIDDILVTQDEVTVSEDGDIGEQRPQKIVCDRMRNNVEVPKTRPTERVMQDL
ncbi:Prenylcysteine lyase-domain-containing protein [Bombardia bombarda]|uniref:Prenylcysteine lyase-domain-containing protein n=1 Tax=Bombardia bombarda TaxID=252184 RepID=A0AA39X0A4_9PEZI|nr:Prenylcysteine lyase-domain-containing protein [Bombardia bombarda]